MIEKYAPYFFVAMALVAYLLGMTVLLVWLKRRWTNLFFGTSCKAVTVECGFGSIGGNYVMDFGKYRGVSLKNVPDNYLIWLIDHGVMMQKPKLLACYREMVRKGRE